MNLGSALNELLPRKARLVLYVIVALLLLALTAWQTAQGDLLGALFTFISTAAPVLAAGNITPPAEEFAVEETDGGL